MSEKDGAQILSGTVYTTAAFLSVILGQMSVSFAPKQPGAPATEITSYLPAGGLEFLRPNERWRFAVPVYDYICLDCHKTFEVVLTLSEHDKEQITCPQCKSKNVEQEATAFFAVTSHKS